MTTTSAPAGRSSAERTSRIVLIGGGPRAAIVLERIAANAPELL